MSTHVAGEPKAGDATDLGADQLNRAHQGIGQKQGPAEAEPELRARLRIGRDPAWIVIRRAGDEARPQYVAKPWTTGPFAPRERSRRRRVHRRLLVARKAPRRKAPSTRSSPPIKEGAMTEQDKREKIERRRAIKKGPPRSGLIIEASLWVKQPKNISDVVLFRKHIRRRKPAPCADRRETWEDLSGSSCARMRSEGALASPRFLHLRRREARDQFVRRGRIGELDEGHRFYRAPGAPLDHQAWRAFDNGQRSGGPLVGAGRANLVLGGGPWHALDQPGAGRQFGERLILRFGYGGEIDQPLFEAEGLRAGEMAAGQFERRSRRRDLEPLAIGPRDLAFSTAGDLEAIGTAKRGSLRLDVVDFQ